MNDDEAHVAGAPRRGDILAGKYRVAGVLGVGGMGIVVEAEQIHLKRQVAIKVLRPGVSAESVIRFMREAQAAAAIKSEHVARIVDVCESAPGAPCLVMEYLEGRDLRRLLDAGERLDPKTAANYMIQACHAIAEAHAAGIVHRDIKPENLFIASSSSGEPCVKVLDFGISKILTQTPAPGLTTTHDALGTPSYMSPEQVRSASNVDARTDVWALGVVLYELVTGALPFEGETASAMNAAIVADPPVALRDRRADLPVAFERVVMRCIEKDPSRRFPSAAALARALAPFARRPDEAAAVVPVTDVENDVIDDVDPAGKKDGAKASANRQRLRVSTMALGVGAVLAIGIVSMVLGRATPTAHASGETGTTTATTATATALTVEPSNPNAPTATIDKEAAATTAPTMITSRVSANGGAGPKVVVARAPSASSSSSSSSSALPLPPLLPTTAANPFEDKLLLNRK